MVPAEMVADTKRDARAWAALYQQEPASDYAVTDKAGDYTEHGIFRLDRNRNLYVLDWWSGQATADIWIEARCDLIQQRLKGPGPGGLVVNRDQPFKPAIGRPIIHPLM
jgi:hypothetical protein